MKISVIFVFRMSLIIVFALPDAAETNGIFIAVHGAGVGTDVDTTELLETASVSDVVSIAESANESSHCHSIQSKHTFSKAA